MGVSRGLLVAAAFGALLTLPAPAPAQDPVPAPAPTARAVDRSYRATQAAIEIRGDRLVVDASHALGPLARRLRAPGPVHLRAACSEDVAGLDLDRPRPGRDFGSDENVTPDVRTATVSITVPGLDRAASRADGCRAVVTETLGYPVAEVVVGFTQDVRRELYTRSLRTGDRDRQALAGAEAAVTSALTHYVSHGDDLRGWTATPDGRVPGEPVLRLGTAVSVAAVGLMPVNDDVVRQILPPGRRRSRSQLVVAAASTAISERIIVIERDFADGLQRYTVVDRDGHVRYRGSRPPFASCTDPVEPARCTDERRS